MQCKNWARSKTIHLKYIDQFYGTVCRYIMRHPKKKVHGTFFSSTHLSDQARLAAHEFRMILHEGFPLRKRFPIIKCKRGVNGERVFYLPTDWRYDSIKLNLKEGDCYCETVAEAESKGFNWHGASA